MTQKTEGTAEPAVESAIVVKDLHKSFKLPHEQSSGIKQSLVNFATRKKGYEVQQVLNGLSFEIKKGDFFGIVGRNGSGKSTLLKSLAGIYAPDKGLVQVNGSLVPFIELGVGFNPELTGRENVYLNGALLGFSHDEMKAMYDDIVEFAELEKFMDQKLKNYSSGMQVRLAFSIAIRADGDILLLDEVLAVGDEAFQRKCNDYFRELKKKGKTVILVTHSMDDVRKYCNKAMMIRDGKVVVYGRPEDVANEYSVENLETVESRKSDDAQQLVKNAPIGDLRVDVGSIKQISQDDEVTVVISYVNHTNGKTKPHISVDDESRNVPIMASYAQPTSDEKVDYKFVFKLDCMNDTIVKISVSVRNSANEVIGFAPDKEAPRISLRRTDYLNPKKKHTYAVLFNRGEWR